MSGITAGLTSLGLAATAREAARRFGDRVAFVDGQESLTYAGLDQRSDEVAAGLTARGVGFGDVVALALPTALDYPICYLAAAKLGAITAGINKRLSAGEQEALVGLVAPRLVIDDSAVVASLRRTGESVPAVSADPADPVAIVFTSGTTGTPKGAVFAGRQLAAIRAIDVGEEWGRGGATLAGTSLSHLGFMTKFGGSLQNGSTSYLMRRWRAEDALRMTAEHRLSVLSGVPTQIALMLAHPLASELDLSSVQLVIIGGAPATPALVREVRARLGVAVSTRYSCTEAGIGCGTHPSDPPEDAEETVGRPQPGVELAIRDDEVLLRSAAVMSGYWNDPDATATALTEDGFVRTGDLGYVDERGRLHLVGRRKEMYVRGGYNVFPVEVEAVLASAPGVRAVAVVPRVDDVMGEIGVAVVVPEGAPPELDALREYGAERLAAYKLPEDIRCVEELPLTAGDKVDRKALQALISSG
ncbi:MAG: class I adenylate-forming enzyme family protein [Actinomycetes bacterium]